MILKLILYALIIILSNTLSYKLIRFIDKRERKKLQNWELDFIDSINNDNSDEINDDSDNKIEEIEEVDELF